MTKIRANLAVSLDGFAAGPNQNAENPFGEGVDGSCTAGCSRTPRPTPRRSTPTPRRRPTSWAATCSAPAAAPGTREWNGWWGPNPPYHAPVYVLTHHERESVEMEGGTTFHFVTDGIEPRSSRPGGGRRWRRADRRRRRHGQRVPGGRPARRAAPARRPGRARARASGSSTASARSRSERGLHPRRRSSSRRLGLTSIAARYTRWRTHQKQPPSSRPASTKNPAVSIHCSVQ